MILKNQIDFMGKRRIAAFCSGVLIIISLLSLLFSSLQFGLDFTSGTSVRLAYDQTVNISEVNDTLDQSGYQDALVVTFGSDRDIRIILPVDAEIDEAE
ncbi:MAG: protein translocase subunit SecF, partial [Gammaproteobacteria bacterium]|nr:protein translocase subunit SecF [Gammaproteobacteria bacterium]